MKGTLESSDYQNRVPRKPEGLTEDAAAEPTPSAGAAQPDRPPEPDGEPKQHKGLWWKILAGLGIGCLTINAVMGIVFVSTMSLGLSSCMASCSDNPIGDSREDAAFIANLEANGRDLQVFDALRGCMDSLYERRVAYAQDSEEPIELPYSPDQVRAAIVAGAWLEDDTGDSRNPRVWVRLAELSQSWLERETGESWEVVDFAYPFPDNSPIPVPAVRDEDSVVLTLLRCSSGADEGMFVQVGYYRWQSPAIFESDLDERRTEVSGRQEKLAQLRGLEALQGRTILYDKGDLYVWSQGEGDPLRDFETFLAFANGLKTYLNSYADVVLLAEDTPAYIDNGSLSGDYPNNRPRDQVSIDVAQQRLLYEGWPSSFDHAAGDELLAIYLRDDRELTEGDLKGSLAPVEQRDYRIPSVKVDDDAVYDENLASKIAESLGISDASQVLAVSKWEETSFDEGKLDYGEDSLDAWVLVPRGALPETPYEFCATALQVSDVAWDQMEQVESHKTAMALRLYVIDPETVTDPQGDATTYAQMRAGLMADPTQLGDYSFDVLLAVMPYYSRWENSSSVSRYGCEVNDIGGSIAYSREWRYDE